MAEVTERGSGTVLMAIVMTIAGFLIMVTLMLGSAIVARHRAGAIADLSALAAASALPAPRACDHARRVAAANAGRLVRCRILGDGSVVVDVELADGHGVRGLPGTASGSARAGRAATPALAPASVGATRTVTAASPSRPNMQGNRDHLPRRFVMTQFERVKIGFGRSGVTSQVAPIRPMAAIDRTNGLAVYVKGGYIQRMVLASTSVSRSAEFVMIMMASIGFGALQ